MTVLLANSTVSISGTVSYTGLSASIQPDTSDGAQIPRLLAGAGGELDLRHAYVVLVDAQATTPTVGDVVTVTDYNGHALPGDWVIWKEPRIDDMFDTCELAVVRKIS